MRRTAGRKRQSRWKKDREHKRQGKGTQLTKIQGQKKTSISSWTQSPRAGDEVPTNANLYVKLINASKKKRMLIVKLTENLTNKKVINQSDKNINS